MPYRFELDETFADGLRRISAEQVQTIAGLLEAGKDAAKGVHEARKSLKRLRALLRLMRAGLDGEAYTRANHQLRDTARLLSGVRDAQAMLECIALLEAHHGRAGHNAILVALAAELRGAKRGQDRRPSSVEPTPALAALAEAREQLAHLEPIGEGIETIAGSLERSYRGGRRAMGRALETGRDEDFHDWRKRVQHHWRHMQLLSRAWPDMMGARVAAAKELSEILGQGQDLSLVAGHIAKAGGRLGKAGAIEACLDLCRRRQSELRALAEPLGRRLFSEKPAAFASSIARHWQTAAEIERTTAKAARRHRQAARPKRARPKRSRVSARAMPGRT